MVPRFYFDVREGASFTPDDEGLEFASLDAAERMAAEIGQAELPKGNIQNITVEVSNEHGQRVLTATATLEIHRVDLEPLPPACVKTCRAICSRDVKKRACDTPPVTGGSARVSQV